MAEQWIKLPLDRELFRNLDEDAVTGYQVAIENGFINELGGHTRFPGLRDFCDLSDNGRVYLHELNGDMIAATSKGRVYRINRSGQVTDVTGTAVSGGRRVIFQLTDTELLMAAGSQIIRLRNEKTEVLSENAPLASHVAWIDGYTIAPELNSGQFLYSSPNAPDQWDPLNVQLVDGNPDPITTTIVTPFREIMLGGAKSIEQFERVQSGDNPFFRRWAIGDGVAAPYCLVFADNAIWLINAQYEFVRSSGQISEAKSSSIGRMLEQITDWRDAWIGGYPDKPLNILGQKFILLQAPYAVNSYGTEGITLLYDYKQNKWSELFDFNADDGTPTRWRGWSHWQIWNRYFVGGEGKVYEVTLDQYRQGSDIQRWLVRTGHTTQGDSVQVNGFRLQIGRGRGTNTFEGEIGVRCSRDGNPFGPWKRKGMGKAGQRKPFIEFGQFGNGNDFQFEISVTDNVPVDLIRAEIQTTPLGH